MDRHFNSDDFGMDLRQFEALRYALTSELAILQGPPGTVLNILYFMYIIQWNASSK